MVNRGKSGGTNPPSSTVQDVPNEFPQVTPQDLHPTSDIRFVMLEVGKLTANVARLIDDVKTQGEKLDALSHQASYIKGGIAVSVALIGVFIWIASSFLDHKWDNAISALAATVKPQPQIQPPSIR